MVFTIVLTTGTLWRFFTAYNQDGRLKIFRSAELATNDDDDGTIIEFLKDMVSHFQAIMSDWLSSLHTSQIIYPKSPMVQTDFDETVSYN
jgi:hypothetical protein